MEEKIINEVGELRDVKAAIELLGPRILGAAGSPPNRNDPEYQDLRPELAAAVGYPTVGVGGLYEFFHESEVRAKALAWVKVKLDEAGDDPRRGLVQFKSALVRLMGMREDLSP